MAKQQPAKTKVETAVVKYVLLGGNRDVGNYRFLDPKGGDVVLEDDGDKFLRCVRKNDKSSKKKLWMMFELRVCWHGPDDDDDWTAGVIKASTFCRNVQHAVVKRWMKKSALTFD